jgi:hypothetical protein
MDVFPEGCQFVCLDRGQAATEDDGLWILFLGQVEQVAALGGCGVSDRTAIDDKQLRRLRGVYVTQAGPFEKLANLLAFVVIDFAAQC